MRRLRPLRTVAAILSAAVLATALSAAAFAEDKPGSGDDNVEFRIDASMPYLAFDKLATTKIDVPGGRLFVGLAPGHFQLDRQRLLDWVGRSARAISVYYRDFPVASARILLVPHDGAEPSGGQAFCNAGAAVRLLVGRDITQKALDEDWQLPHEMVHLAFPTLPSARWLSEGLAVYVESIARAQAGDLTREHIWNEFVRMMPTGLPKKGEKGIDDTDTQERTYWGGAIFWMLADLEILRRTDNRVGLQDGLLAVRDAGGTCEAVWPIARALATADKATGQTVLTDLYRTWHAGPVRPDLDGVWRDLGVRLAGKTVQFDDKAPHAAARLAITARRAGAPSPSSP